MFCDRLLKFTINLHLCECYLFVSSVREVEDAAVVLIGVASPHGACLIEEVFLLLHVPVLVLAIELQIFTVRHVVHGQDAVFALHRHVLLSGDSRGHHLFKVVHFIHMLVLVPETVRAVDEDKVFVTVVDHLAHIVEVYVLKQDKD